MDKNIETLRNSARDHVMNLQDKITSAIEEIESTSTEGKKFEQHLWERPGGGGGRSRVLTEGAVFERAGVNFSEVHGEFTEEFAKKLPAGDGLSFYATGVSLVFHPRSPMVPTTHLNYRFIQRGSAFWFGGGQDLTPYYPFEEDCVHFHKTMKDVCDRFDSALYPKFKKDCDEYFYNHHRDEPRGIGGTFFDYQQDADFYECWKAQGEAFLSSYLPIVQKRKDLEYGERERDFQLYRRGRYVEFNLIHDRGTLFGLKTKGNIESILMSLPPVVRWEFNRKEEEGSEEAKLYEFLNRKQWV